MAMRAEEIHREVAGDGPGLLLIHGYGTWAAWWSACGYDVLQERYRVVAVDVPGHGRSPRPHDPDAYRMDAIAELLVQVMAEEGFDQFEVWGHGTGGTISQAIALTGHATRLVSGGCTLAVPTELYQFWATPLIPAVRSGDWQPLLDRFGTPPAPLPSFDEAHDREALACFLEGNPWSTTPDALRDTGIPLVCYLGEDDMAMFMGPSQAEAAGATFLTVPGTVGQSFTDGPAVLPLVLPALPPLG